MSADFALFGRDMMGEPITQDGLRARFAVPPFSILSAASGDWQERKRMWLGYGIRSEVGRSAKAYHINGWLDFKGIKNHPAASDGISIFDPVLCECCYRWWCPSGGLIVDPFAGGSVRGIVAGMLGYRYWGCDLREEQILENRKQAEEIAVAVKPAWVCGDSRETVPGAPPADFLFSCPPYGDLEAYSDDPRDISGMDFRAFVGAYKDIIAKSCERLKQDRFAVFVVGDFRDKRTGFLRNFVSGTISCFKVAGLQLYNEVILSTPAASAAIRASKQFTASRKSVRTHQNVLCFVKGRWEGAVEYIKACEGESPAP